MRLDLEALRKAHPALPVARYTPARKAAIVAAIRAGAIDSGEAQSLYDITDSELAAWNRDIDSHGVAGLRVTRLQAYALSRR